MGKFITKNKNIVTMIFALGVLVCIYSISNIEVEIERGINSEVSVIKMPLYMKILDFWTRSNHYKLLVEKITKNSKTDKDKLLVLFEWTSKNIRKVPESFPVVDDHVDNIIIRGYGTDDQSADVFTTLSVSMGFKAAMYLIKLYPEGIAYVVSLVEFNNRLLLFDTYSHFFFLIKMAK